MVWSADYFPHLKWFELAGYVASLFVACSFYIPDDKKSPGTDGGESQDVNQIPEGA